MKESFWGYFIIILGMFVLVVILLVQRLTVTNEESFYLTREVLEASMIDAVDYGSYRLTGRIVMSSEKFQEVFIRRFAESVTNNKDYTIEFYDIYEEPPKASVRIRTSGGSAEINSDEFGITIDTILSGILETKRSDNTLDNNDKDKLEIHDNILNEEQPEVIIDFDNKEQKIVMDDFCYNKDGSIKNDQYCQDLLKKINEQK